MYILTTPSLSPGPLAPKVLSGLSDGASERGSDLEVTQQSGEVSEYFLDRP